MSVVSIAEAWPSPGKPFTVAELDRMPDDGHRYELLDGVLVVSPGPVTRTKRWRPSCSACSLRDGRYVEAARAGGGEPFQARRPFAVEVVPARLVAGLQPPA